MRIIIEGTQEEVTEALRKLSASDDIKPILAPPAQVAKMAEPDTEAAPKYGRVQGTLRSDRRQPAIPIPWDAKSTCTKAPDRGPRLAEPLSFTMASVTGRK